MPNCTSNADITNATLRRARHARCHAQHTAYHAKQTAATALRCAAMRTLKE
jgi:hypothetical protein